MPGARGPAPLLTGVAALAAAVLLPGRAVRAHCAMPEVRRPMLRPGAPNEIRLFMSFGNAISLDDGATWRLQCEEVYLPPGSESIGPQNVHVTPKGTLVVGHFNGLLTSTNDGCSYRKATGIPDDAAGFPISLIDIALDQSDPDNRIWALIGDTVYHSTDAGRTVVPTRKFPDHTLLRVRTTAAHPAALYVVSFTDTVSFKLHISSTLNGTDWETHLWPFGDQDLTMTGISAADPKRLYALVGIDNQTLHVSDDRGKTFRKLFEVTSPDIMETDRKLSVALGPAPGEIWVGVHGDDLMPGSGQLHRSLDGGAIFARVAGTQPHFRCLEHLDGKLWACGNNLAPANDAFAVGTSTDGTAWTKKFSFGELCQSISCATATCDPVLDNVCVPGICARATVDPSPGREGVDAGAADGIVEPPGVPGDAGCCRTAGSSMAGGSTGAKGVVLLAVLAGIAACRRCRRRD